MTNRRQLLAECRTLRLDPYENGSLAVALDLLLESGWTPSEPEYGNGYGDGYGGGSGDGDGSGVGNGNGDKLKYDKKRKS